VFNKTDANPDVSRLLAGEPGSVAVSALTGDGMAAFAQSLSDRLRSLAKVVELLVPYERGDVVAAVHRSGDVIVESHENGATRLRARLDQAEAARFRDWAVAPS
jgi:GTP-binding protein HflX